MTDSAAVVPMDVGLSVDRCPRCDKVHDPRFCDAHSRSGEQCGNVRGKATNHVGFGHCSSHGGRSQTGVAFAAKERERVALGLLLAADPSARVLHAIVADPSAPVRERRLAAEAILDRAGLPARNIVLLGEAPPEPLDDRRARIAADLEALLAGTVIDTTLNPPGGAGEDDSVDGE